MVRAAFNASAGTKNKCGPQIKAILLASSEADSLVIASMRKVAT